MYGFSSLLKQNKKAKICFVICFAGFFFLKIFCYEVIVKQKIYKRSSNYYSYVLKHSSDVLYNIYIIYNRPVFKPFSKQFFFKNVMK
jgi:hypothetical protein